MMHAHDSKNIGVNHSHRFNGAGATAAQHMPARIPEAFVIFTYQPEWSL